MTAIDRAMQKLVDNGGGTVSREIFCNQDIYDQEMEQVFKRSWLFVGHESQIPRPGDFMLSRMGEEAVIVTRVKQARVQVLLPVLRAVVAPAVPVAVAASVRPAVAVLAAVAVRVRVAVGRPRAPSVVPVVRRDAVASRSALVVKSSSRCRPRRSVACGSARATARPFACRAAPR